MLILDSALLENNKLASLVFLANQEHFHSQLGLLSAQSAHKILTVWEEIFLNSKLVIGDLHHYRQPFTNVLK